MTEITGLHFQTGNNTRKDTTSIRKQYDEFEESAFDSYKKFKEKAASGYNNFCQETNLNYEEALNAVNANEEFARQLADSTNWKEYKASEGAKLPVFDKPETAPVYTPETKVVQAEPAVSAPVTGPSEGENPEYDSAVHGQAIPESQASEVPQEQKTEEKPVADEVPEGQSGLEQEPEPVKVNAKGVSGSYSISEGKDGKGFSLQMNMSVSLLQNQEIRSLFFPANRSLSRDGDGNYSFRNIKSKDYNDLNRKITNTAQQVMMRQAIYNDLMTKQNSGTELTEPEQNFIQSYLNGLDKLGLEQDSNGRLIEKSK